MPVVKRFRTLGQTRENSVPTEDKTSPIEDKPHKTVQRFKTFTETRKRRSDRKHRFSLRIAHTEWDKIKELSLNCGSSETGASLNVIVVKLLREAIGNPEIVNKILAEYPDRDEIIAIRTWG